MLLTPEELQSNLDRLRAKISGARCCDTEDEHILVALSSANAMPLSHTTHEKSLTEVLRSGALLSADERGATSRPADVLLGGTDDICFYLGSAAFPYNEFGFLFSSSLTSVFRGKASATPFDSGGCVSRYPLPEGIDGPTQVSSHSMPVPECREYLGDLLSSQFENTHAYLAGRPFTCPSCSRLLTDPHGMPEGDEHALVRMLEIRVPKRVDLSHPQLLAVLAPKGNVPPSLAPLIASGVQLVTYDTTADRDRTRALRKESIAYIQSNLLN